MTPVSMDSREFKEELQRLFRPYNWYQELVAENIRFHPFICLSSPHMTAVPNRVHLNMLNEMGLGYKVIRYDASGVLFQLKSILRLEFPGLQGTDFDFNYSPSATPGTMLVHIPDDPHAALATLFNRRSNIIYIRPFSSINP